MGAIKDSVFGYCMNRNVTAQPRWCVKIILLHGVRRNRMRHHDASLGACLVSIYSGCWKMLLRCMKYDGVNLEATAIIFMPNALGNTS